jgi:hypothetical protein
MQARAEFDEQQVNNQERPGHQSERVRADCAGLACTDPYVFLLGPLILHTGMHHALDAAVY